MPARREEFQRFERIEKRRVAMLDRARALDEEELNRPPANGGWSVAQVFAHLVTAEKGTLSYIRHKLEKHQSLPRAGAAAAVRSFLLSLGLRSRLRFTAPPVAAVVPERLSFNEIEGEWQAVHGGWALMLEEFPSEALDRAVFRHPFAGRMGLGHALRFVEDHLEHHERQIERILRSNGRRN